MQPDGRVHHPVQRGRRAKEEGQQAEEAARLLLSPHLRHPPTALHAPLFRHVWSEPVSDS